MTSGKQVFAIDTAGSCEPSRVARELSELLKRCEVTISVAESCSGGLIAKLLTDTPGSSGYFIAGVVAYANNAKSHFLGVPADMIERHGAVSTEVAVAMARGVRRATGSDLALATTGIAGPDGGSAEKPVGTVLLALADKNGCETMELHLTGNRNQVRIATAYHALDWLVRHLSSPDSSSRSHAQ
jgi:nicotinamide-nucleotide amidase